MKKNEKFCPYCSYGLVLKDYVIENEDSGCYLRNEEFLDKSNATKICEQRYYCYECNKYL